MANPESLFFAKTHEWVEYLSGGRARVGVSDHAQSEMGDVVFVNLCDADETLSAGDVFGDVESIKAVSDLLSPVDGRVKKVNETLLEMPEGINTDPYGSWLLELGAVRENPELMDFTAYEAFLSE